MLDKNKAINMDFIKTSGNFNSSTAFIYKNSTKLSDVSFNNPAMNLEDTKLQIGRTWQWNSTNRTLNGVICSIRVYNRVLTEDEINQNYKLDKSRFNIN